MKKKEALKRWAGLKPNQKVNPSVVPYKHEGSTFDQDGIRLTGSQEFIDSVLSHLKSYLELENGETRLSISYAQATDRHTKEKLDSYQCYVQVHERGPQAQMANAFMRGA